VTLAPSLDVGRETTRTKGNGYPSCWPDWIFCFSRLTSSFRSIPRSVCSVGDCTDSSESASRPFEFAKSTGISHSSIAPPSLLYLSMQRVRSTIEQRGTVSNGGIERRNIYATHTQYPCRNKSRVVFFLITQRRLESHADYRRMFVVYYTMYVLISGCK